MMPMMMPPMYPPPPPPRGRSFAGAIFTTLATTVLGLSILLNVILLFSSASEREGTKTEVLVDGDSSQQVAVIPIHGIIDESMVEHFDKMLKEVEKNSSVKAIVLDIDSPGGGVTASDEIYNKLVALREQKHIPIVGTIGELGAHGAYYISCGCDYVFAEKTSWTGSIGVIMPNYNIHDLTDKYGIKETTIIADGAIFKNAGSMMQPVNPRDEQYFQDLCNRALRSIQGGCQNRTQAQGEHRRSCAWEDFYGEGSTRSWPDRSDRLRRGGVGQGGAACGAEE